MRYRIKALPPPYRIKVPFVVHVEKSATRGKNILHIGTDVGKVLSWPFTGKSLEDIEQALIREYEELKDYSRSGREDRLYSPGYALLQKLDKCIGKEDGKGEE